MTGRQATRFGNCINLGWIPCSNDVAAGVGICLNRFNRLGDLVDFTTLADAARPAGVTISRLATQGDWLRRLGIDARLTSLTAAAPDRADELRGQRDRLVGTGEMGELFKLIAITAPGWPAPAGFSGGPA